jgi:hypothetical protein
VFSNKIENYNIKQNYKNITKHFCTYYYNLYDDDCKKLENLYNKSSVFTFCEEEFPSYFKLCNQIKLFLGIYKFKHYVKTIDSQPIGEKGLLINITGTLSVNNIQTVQKYVETIVLEQDMANNFYIINTIFRVIE